MVKSEGEMEGGALKDVCSCQMLERYAQCTLRSRNHHTKLEGSALQRENILSLGTLRIFQLYSYPTAHTKTGDGVPAVPLPRRRRRRRIGCD